MPTLFGKKLKELRESKGETQTQLGKLLGVTIKQVQRYENDVFPKPDKIQVLNKHYKYDFFSLLGDQSNGTTVPDVDQFLVSKMLKCDAMQEVILSVLAELLSKQTGQPMTSVLSQLERSVIDKQTRIKEELKRSE